LYDFSGLWTPPCLLSERPRLNRVKLLVSIHVTKISTAKDPCTFRSALPVPFLLQTVAGNAPTLLGHGISSLPSKLGVGFLSLFFFFTLCFSLLSVPLFWAAAWQPGKDLWSPLLRDVRLEICKLFLFFGFFSFFCYVRQIPINPTGSSGRCRSRQPNNEVFFGFPHQFDPFSPLSPWRCSGKSWSFFQSQKSACDRTFLCFLLFFPFDILPSTPSVHQIKHGAVLC